MSTLEVAIIVILIFAVASIGYSYYKALQHQKEIIQKPATKGMNGIGGDTIKLQCPVGQTISFEKLNSTSTRGALVCLGDKDCDAFFQPGEGQNNSFYNKQNIIDLMSGSSPFKDLSECEGKQECLWTIPTSSDSKLPTKKGSPGSCLGSCKGKLAFIGTYDCKA